MLISEEGVIRYNVTAEEWKVFDQMKPPFNALEKGVMSCGECRKIENCPTLGVITANNPDALKNLKSASCIRPTVKF